MKLNLSGQNKTSAFSSCKRILFQRGFHIERSDLQKGLIFAKSPIQRSDDCLFFNILFSESENGIVLIFIANQFSTRFGTFIANEESEKDFVANLLNEIDKRPVENPFLLSKEDYAMAS